MISKPQSGVQTGQKPCLVPYLTEKLHDLLEAQGRNQAWMAGHLAIRDGAISNWKRRPDEPAEVPGRVPERHVAPICHLLGIPRSTFLTSSLADFKADLEALRQLGSGQRWKALLERQRDRDEALELLVEGARTYGNLSFRPQRGSDPHTALQTVRLDQKVRLGLPDALIDDLRARSDWKDAEFDLVLCCEDRQGWQVFCPSPYRWGFELHQGRWLMPPSGREAMHLCEPIGRWTAVTVVCGRRVPDAIAAELRSSVRGVKMALDLFASWLHTDQVPHLVLSKPFLVTPAQR